MRAKSGLLAVLFCCTFLLGACSSDPVIEDAVITIDNDSNVIIIEVNLALSGEAYGADELSTDLFPDEFIDIIVDPEVYDVRITDEFNVECEVLDVDVFDADDVIYAALDCGF